MSRIRTAMLGLCVSALLPALSGCRYLAVQAMHEVRGAQGTVHTPNPITPAVFSRFRDIEFEPARADFADPMIPRALLRAYDDGSITAVGKLRDKFPGGDPALRIAATFLYFQSRSFTSGGEAIARVRFFDGSSVLVDSIVRAESESFRAGDEPALARAMVDAIVRALRGPLEADTPANQP